MEFSGDNYVHGTYIIKYDNFRQICYKPLFYNIPYYIDVLLFIYKDLIQK